MYPYKNRDPLHTHRKFPYVPWENYSHYEKYDQNQKNSQTFPSSTFVTKAYPSYQPEVKGNQKHQGHEGNHQGRRLVKEQETQQSRIRPSGQPHTALAQKRSSVGSIKTSDSTRALPKKLNSKNKNPPRCQTPSTTKLLQKQSTHMHFIHKISESSKSVSKNYKKMVQQLMGKKPQNKKQKQRKIKDNQQAVCSSTSGKGREQNVSAQLNQKIPLKHGNHTQQNVGCHPYQEVPFKHGNHPQQNVQGNLNQKDPLKHGNHPQQNSNQKVAFKHGNQPQQNVGCHPNQKVPFKYGNQPQQNFWGHSNQKTPFKHGNQPQQNVWGHPNQKVPFKYGNQPQQNGNFQPLPLLDQSLFLPEKHPQKYGRGQHLDQSSLLHGKHPEQRNFNGQHQMPYPILDDNIQKHPEHITFPRSNEFGATFGSVLNPISKPMEQKNSGMWPQKTISALPNKDKAKRWSFF